MGRSVSSPNMVANWITVSLLFISLAFNFHLLSKDTYSSAPPFIGQHDLPTSEEEIDYDAPTSIVSNVKDGDDDDEAMRIIKRSYAKTYAHILPCADNEEGQTCMKKTAAFFNKKSINANGTSTIPSIPWWFQTLLRDIIKNGSYGFWHKFRASNPPINFCTIGKVATTEWRKVFCQLNKEECMPNPKEQCGKRECRWVTQKKVPDNTPWAVFLRDPLERLLSGFIDKCYKPGTRKNEGHCEPNIIYNVNPNMVDRKNKTYPQLIQDLADKDKQFFGSYVDTLPLRLYFVKPVFETARRVNYVVLTRVTNPPPALFCNDHYAEYNFWFPKWNVHFVPQAIACDLHRRINNFDFVGIMGKNFMFELDRMANQFGGQLPEVLNASFSYIEHVKFGEQNNTGKEKNGHATHAPAKVQQFYTAQTVRRGLELLSIDYVLLGLEVPEWARQMLKDDTA